jgi:ABC-type uncharacterized transport system fused permease/ATPase subunit
MAFIGRGFVNVSENKNQAEAEYRYVLTRLREHGESIGGARRRTRRAQCNQPFADDGTAPLARNVHSDHADDGR